MIALITAFAKFDMLRIKLYKYLWTDILYCHLLCEVAGDILRRRISLVTSEPAYSQELPTTTAAPQHLKGAA